MSGHVRKEQGFSTIELLISLFIAAAFIGTGFQLFSAVTNDSNEARLRAAAASIANTAIEKNAHRASRPCGPPPSPVVEDIPTAELPQATVTVTYTCPYGPAARTSRVTAVVQYGDPQEEVEGSLDVSE